MSVLSSAFAAWSPGVGDLWTSLARDERGHGARLRSLAEKSDDMTAFVEKLREQTEKHHRRLSRSFKELGGQGHLLSLAAVHVTG